MRVPTQVGYALGVAAAVVLFAGCSGSGSSYNAAAPGLPGMTQSVIANHVPTILPGAFLKGFHPSAPVGGKSFVNPNVTGALVYSCGYYANECVWSKPGSNVMGGALTGLSNPQGVTVDKLGNVYIANTGGSNILVYPKGSTTLSKTLSDTGQYPVDVAVTPTGAVFAANIFTTSFTAGTVSFYKPGATSPTKIITDSNFYQVISVGLDELGEVVVCYNNSSGVGACDKSKGSSSTHTTVISGLGFSGGVEADPAGNWAVNDQLNGTKYFNSSFTSCGADAYNSDELFLAFDHSGADIYKANASNGNLEENSYTACSGATSEHVFTSGFWTSSDPPFGVTVDPGPAL